ncbi:hypothetical protein BRADI_1g14965v3 [Brachypodium distachyon]|uniref:Uncharacterized protein n=1 Tax=Brachypodium distachyon TaxID=15368 RepID=A0A0Q3JQI3_BRADI|nr:hypothetical protein BRADI_1g14965v3 [Brachypodium distachyon]KQK14252.1 hypothetical protein BRADI_1g14965v3 [Brachypodium distachyon]PNT74456.1 hypothetical protein BRADI_1g14965v3 [Brachypodium distachyon]PNT74457.1 hypothetical protein BRADI_1g14965v3 [Brachypodium distachyon]PNT74458.1 hypothetical protein BRADI_1g14965v3 [Brachypodium distachyon]
MLPTSTGHCIVGHPFHGIAVVLRPRSGHRWLPVPYSAARSPPSPTPTAPLAPSPTRRRPIRKPVGLPQQRRNALGRCSPASCSGRHANGRSCRCTAPGLASMPPMLYRERVILLPCDFFRSRRLQLNAESLPFDARVTDRQGRIDLHMSQSSSPEI